MSLSYGFDPKIVFFDLDGTLIQESEADAAALGVVIRTHAPDLEPVTAQLIRAVKQAAGILWNQSGEIDYCRRIGTSASEGLFGDYAGDDPHLSRLRAYIDEGAYRERAWAEGLAAVGRKCPDLAVELAIAYAQTRAGYHIAYPESRPTLESLQGRCRVGLITNGASRLQRSKFEGSGLAAFFDPSLIIISGDLGIGKPAPEIYRHALGRVGCTPAEAVMIGNNPIADIQGAQAAGIRAIWVCRADALLPVGIIPDQIVHRLDQCVF